MTKETGKAILEHLIEVLGDIQRLSEEDKTEAINYLIETLTKVFQGSVQTARNDQ